MTGKQHMTVGLGISLATLNPIFIGSALLGSIVPDVDSHSSIISTYIPIQRLTAGIFMKHRGGIHSIFSSVIFSVVYGVVVYNLKIVQVLLGDNILNGVIAGLGFLVGYISHLLTDMLTHRGVPLYYPWNKKRIRFLRRGLDRLGCEGVASIVFLLGITLAAYRTGWF